MQNVWKTNDPECFEMAYVHPLCQFLFQRNLHNLIARSQLTERGPLGFGPIQFWIDLWDPISKKKHTTIILCPRTRMTSWWFQPI